MSLQTYIRPFISCGKFTNFKELSAPRTHEFGIYGTDTGTIHKIDDEYQVNPGGDMSGLFYLDDPDFNFRSIQGNAVFRWEYMPGSTLFLVWQQQRNEYASVGDFAMRRDFGELFRAKPTNVFMAKISYWFGT